MNARYLDIASPRPSRSMHFLDAPVGSSLVQLPGAPRGGKKRDEMVGKIERAVYEEVIRLAGN